MSAKPITYQQARNQIQSGDVVAFGGQSHFSQLVKLATLSNVSHVGVILQTQIADDNAHRGCNQIIESTRGKGVEVSRFSDRLQNHVGELWWLPLGNIFVSKPLMQPSFLISYLLKPRPVSPMTCRKQ